MKTESGSWVSRVEFHKFSGNEIELHTSPYGVGTHQLLFLVRVAAFPGWGWGVELLLLQSAGNYVDFILSFCFTETPVKLGHLPWLLSSAVIP